MSNPQTPFLDLFQMLRDAGMSLSLEQYDLLRQALGLGYGLGGWDDLRRICRILWVKPSAGTSEELFDRTFNRYIEQYRDTVPVAPPSTPPPQPEPTPPLGELPRIPPRMPVRQEEGKVQAPVAVQTAPPKLPPTDTKAFQLTPTDIPVSLEAVQTAWRALRRRVRVGHQYEPDVEATMAQIEREGLFS